MAKVMYLTGINISKAENGVIVGLSMESDDSQNRKYDHKQHVFEGDDGTSNAAAFVTKQVNDLIKAAE